MQGWRGKGLHTFQNAQERKAARGGRIPLFNCMEATGLNLDCATADCGLKPHRAMCNWLWLCPGIWGGFTVVSLSTSSSPPRPPTPRLLSCTQREGRPSSEGRPFEDPPEKKKTVNGTEVSSDRNTTTLSKLKEYFLKNNLKKDFISQSHSHPRTQ